MGSIYTQKVRLANICRGGTKCLPASSSSLNSSVRVLIRLRYVLHTWNQMLYSDDFLAAFLNSKMRSRSACSLSFVVSGRFHERWKFAGRMLCQLFTTDSLDRPFIQGLFRRLHPGGTTVKWVLSTFAEPGSADTILQ